MWITFSSSRMFPGQAWAARARLRRVGERELGALQLAAVKVEEMRAELAEIAGPVAKRRNDNGCDIDTEVEVLTETTFGDGGGKVDIGGGDDADVHRYGRPAADTHDLALLKDPEQLDLEGEGQVADLVEEEGAAIGGLEPAGLRLQRAGESTLLVSEQFRLDQALDEGAAIDGEERAVLSIRMIVDVAGRHFLAGAGLADDDEARIARRQAFEVGPDGCRAWVGKNHRRRADCLPLAAKTAVEGDDPILAQARRAARGRRVPAWRASANDLITIYYIENIVFQKHGLLRNGISAE